MNEVETRIEEHIPALQRYALSLTRNAAEAENLVQECAVRALSKARLYQPGTNLRAWLFTILRNLHISEKRYTAKWPRAADPELALQNLSVPAAQPASSMLRSVTEAIATLPDPQRRILISVGIEGKTYEEVSDEFGIPIGTVKSRCSRARKALEDRFYPANTDTPAPGLAA